MIRRPALALIFALLPLSTAMAACPPGTRSVRETNNRIVCIQQELAQDTAAKANQFRWNNFQSEWRQNQMQQRLDALPQFNPTPKFGE
jgi:hypothetical protein